MAESVVVGVRVRPFNQREIGLDAKVCIDMDGPLTRITNPADNEEKPFTFDESFWSHDGMEDDGTGYMRAVGGSKYADQRYVFETFGQRVLDNAWNGFHCCLFAYGQTGAGKSYSMVGYGNNKGIVPISCEEIFNRIATDTDKTAKYEVTVSMIEIYNEAVQDLLILPEERPKKGLEIRESKALGIYIDGVLKRAVDSYPAIEACIEEATNHRTVGSTLMNATSSRAHTVQIIEFKAIKPEGSRVSLINLVDLAGSEKAGQTGATGDRLKEGSAINKSLSALGNVIEKLAEKSSGKSKNVLVPYRDSKLTRLLQNALGGSSKTIMICALSPASSNYEETLSTLRYADRAKKIKNVAVVNENPQERLMRELREENEKLKEMVQAMQGGTMPDAAAIKDMGARQQEIAAIEAALEESSKSWEQKLAETKEAQEAHAKRRQSNVFQATEKAQPMIVNLNDDKTLTGRIRHSFPQGRSLLGGMGGGSDSEDSDEDSDDEDDKDGKDDSDEEEEDEKEEEPDIVITADDLEKHHAIVFNKDGNCTLYAAQESTAMNIFVNGRTLFSIIESKDDSVVPEDSKEEEEPEEKADKDGEKKKKVAKPAGAGVRLNHSDRVALGRHFWVYCHPAQTPADVLIASGEVDYASAKHEWQVEQRATMMRRFSGRATLLDPGTLVGGAASTDANEEVLAEKELEIERQADEIAKLKNQLQQANEELAVLRRSGNFGNENDTQFEAAQKIGQISVAIKSTFQDAIDRMKIVEASLQKQSEKPKRDKPRVNFSED